MDRTLGPFNHHTYELLIGRVTIVERNGRIVGISSSNEEWPNTIDSVVPVMAETAEQLQQYFRGERSIFSIPLDPIGTPFQQSVWGALMEIPYGETRSYRDIAVAVGNAKAVRAVGMANNRNPISFIIPCHRVIGSDGSLVGYGGGLPLKRWLLTLEKAARASVPTD